MLRHSQKDRPHQGSRHSIALVVAALVLLVGLIFAWNFSDGAAPSMAAPTASKDSDRRESSASATLAATLPGTEKLAAARQAHGSMSPIRVSLVDAAGSPVAAQGRVRWLEATKELGVDFTEAQLVDGGFELPGANTYYVILEPEQGALPWRGAVDVAIGSSITVQRATALTVRFEYLGNAPAVDRVTVTRPSDPDPDRLAFEVSVRATLCEQYDASCREIVASKEQRSAKDIVAALSTLDAQFESLSKDVGADWHDGWNLPRTVPKGAGRIEALVPFEGEIQVYIEAIGRVRFLVPEAQELGSISASFRAADLADRTVAARIEGTFVFGQLLIHDCGVTPTEVNIGFFRGDREKRTFQQQANIGIQLNSDWSFLAESVPAGSYIISATWRCEDTLNIASAVVDVVEGMFHDVGPLMVGPCTANIQTGFDLPTNETAPLEVTSDTIILQRLPTFQELQSGRFEGSFVLQVAVAFGRTNQVRGLSLGMWNVACLGLTEQLIAADAPDWFSAPQQFECVASGQELEVDLRYRRAQ